MQSNTCCISLSFLSLASSQLHSAGVLCGWVAGDVGQGSYSQVSSVAGTQVCSMYVATCVCMCNVLMYICITCVYVHSCVCVCVCVCVGGWVGGWVWVWVCVCVWGGGCVGSGNVKSHVSNMCTCLAQSITCYSHAFTPYHVSTILCQP